MARLTQGVRLKIHADTIDVEWRVSGEGRRNQLTAMRTIPRDAGPAILSEAVEAVRAEGRLRLMRPDNKPKQK